MRLVHPTVFHILTDWAGWFSWTETPLEMWRMRKPSLYFEDSRLRCFIFFFQITHFKRPEKISNEKHIYPAALHPDLKVMWPFQHSTGYVVSTQSCCDCEQEKCLYVLRLILKTISKIVTINWACKYCLFDLILNMCWKWVNWNWFDQDFLAWIPLHQFRASPQAMRV